MDWIVAANIAERLQDLRIALGLRTQIELGRRAGVGKQQVGKWLRGVQSPSRQRLDSWADREGWPIAIFEEGGPMPSTIVNCAVNVPSGPSEGQVKAATGVLAQAIVEANAILGSGATIWVVQEYMKGIS